MSGRRARARTASEEVAEQIRGQIATGLLKPGDRLPSETTLLDHFQVARPTMREALRVLESDGLVKIQRGVNGGARVQDPEIGRLARRVGLHLQIRGTDLHSMMQAEIVIQPGAVALAAEARTDHDLAELRRAIGRVEASATPEQFAAATAAFLDRLSRASHNQVLTLVSELTTELMREQIVRNSRLRETWPSEQADMITWSVEQYRTVVDLIETGDGDAAERFWRAHLRLADPGDLSSPLTVYRPWGLRRNQLRGVDPRSG
jgi:GntR family transcriptional regulator, transcriptional repressor for pyruvate dehydrogenase complex